MLKIRMTAASGTPILLLGLTRENIEHLQANDSIALNLDEVGMEGLVFIMAGEDQQDIVRQLADAGVVSARTLDGFLRAPQPGESYRWRPPSGS